MAVATARVVAVAVGVAATQPGSRRTGREDRRRTCSTCTCSSARLGTWWSRRWAERCPWSTSTARRMSRPSSPGHPRCPGWCTEIRSRCVCAHQLRARQGARASHSSNPSRRLPRERVELKRSAADGESAAQGGGLWVRCGVRAGAARAEALAGVEIARAQGVPALVHAPGVRERGEEQQHGGQRRWLDHVGTARVSNRCRI